MSYMYPKGLHSRCWYRKSRHRVGKNVLKYFIVLDWDQQIKSSEHIDHFRRHFKLMRLCCDVKERYN